MAFESALAHPLDLHALIQAGLPASLLPRVAASLGVKGEDLAARCGISRATFHRKKNARVRLGRLESDLVARYATLLRQASAVFEDDGAAATWLREPQIGLGGAVPLDLAQTTQGYQEVVKLLTRLDHGVYA